MTLTEREFTGWLDQNGLPTSSAEIARRTGRRPSTITTQRFRSRITEDVVVGLCRAYDLDPLSELALFEPYKALQAEQPPPTTNELLSQLTHTDLQVELLSRGRPNLALLLGAEYVISPIPHEGGVRSWIDAIDPGNIRSEMAQRTGIAPPNLSTLLGENKLSHDLALLASTIAGVSLVSGLVISGLLTAEEGRWPQQGRENALRDVSDLALVDLIDLRLKALRRRFKKEADAHDTAEALAKALG